MNYLTACIKETLRMYPPVQMLPGRKVVKPIDVELKDETIHLGPGDQVTVSVFAIHHDEKYWEKPYE